MPSAATPQSITAEPDAVYRASASRYLTSHALADFRSCPLLYRQKQLGVIADVDSAAYLVGRAAHVLILEGRQRYEAQFAVGGPINPVTGRPFGAATKAFAEWAQRQGKPVLSDTQAAEIESLAASVGGHERARALLATGVAEGVVRATYAGVECQSRIDWFNPTPGVGIVDLKTCSDLGDFEHHARRFGYVHQLAFYRAVLAEATGELAAVHIVAVEKKPPLRCGVWHIPAGVLAVAQRDNELAIARLKLCRSTDIWPTGYEEVRTLDYL